MMILTGFYVMDQRTNLMHPNFASKMFSSEQEAETAIKEYFEKDWFGTKFDILYIRKVFRSVPTGGLAPEPDYTIPMN